MQKCKTKGNDAVAKLLEPLSQADSLCETVIAPSESSLFRNKPSLPHLFITKTGSEHRRSFTVAAQFHTETR